MSKIVTVLEDFQDWNTWYKKEKVAIPENAITYPNQAVVLKGGEAKAHGLIKGSNIVKVPDYYPKGIVPKNTEQTLALGLLADKGIPLTILSGVAGSGKTLLSCAHALQRLQDGEVSKILIAKSMTPIGREIGFLPGGLDEKASVWLGPFYDNFLVAGVPDYEIEDMIEKSELEITPITFIQGRSISNTILIIDEVQNLSINILKQIITRASEGSEVILLGDPSQRFERNMINPIASLIEAGRSSDLVGHIDLIKSIRSPIAKWAVNNL